MDNFSQHSRGPLEVAQFVIFALGFFVAVASVVMTSIGFAVFGVCLMLLASARSLIA